MLFQLRSGHFIFQSSNPWLQQSILVGFFITASLVFIKCYPGILRNLSIQNCLVWVVTWSPRGFHVVPLLAYLRTSFVIASHHQTLYLILVLQLIAILISEHILGRIVTRSPWFSHSVSLLESLHWLPVQPHIIFKLCTIVYQTPSRTFISIVHALFSTQATCRLFPG